MDGQVEISRKYVIRLTEDELSELIQWFENLEDEKDPNSLGDRLYGQLKALKEGRAGVATVELPNDETATAMPIERDPSPFDRLRQTAQQGNPVLDGEWIERS